ncbi:MAG: V-type ATP synthase subunit D [Defluviitaleaceae bacterium]|nr:V-type ATP synthase subunit D [Defluviitaleaceae bacterium]
MKANLLTAKKNLALAKKSHDLLEIKQNALLQDIKREEKIIFTIKTELAELTHIAKHAYIMAAMEVGEDAPPLTYPYELNGTTAAVDNAFFSRGKMLKKENELFEAETILSQKKERLKRTKKRVSALRNVSIPTYEKHVKYITGQIEEYERDEMVRQKAASSV